MLVAEGAVDGAVDAVGVKEWDLAAVQVIVEEAGGRFSDFDGNARIDSGTGVSSNGLLHDELLAATALGQLRGRIRARQTASVDRLDSMPESSDSNEAENLSTPSRSRVSVTSS